MLLPFGNGEICNLSSLDHSFSKKNGQLEFFGHEDGVVVEISGSFDEQEVFDGCLESKNRKLFIIN